MGRLIDDIQETAHNFTLGPQEHFDGPLDYSVESLAVVDDFLDMFSGEDMDEDALFDLSSMVGCYVFEVARRNYGGEYFWIQEEQQPVLVAGRPDFSVEIKVWEKVKGRLLNGGEDNIPFYIAGYKEHIQIGRTRPGYFVTIV